MQLEPPSVVRNFSDSDPLLENQEAAGSSSGESSSSSSSSEIKDGAAADDLEAGSVPSCRICLESDCEPGQLFFSREFIMLFIKYIVYDDDTLYVSIYFSGHKRSN